MAPPIHPLPHNYDLAASDQFAHLPPWVFEATWEEYQYAPGVNGLCALPGAAAALSFPVQVESNAHFVICKTTMLVTDQAAPPNVVALPLVLAQLQQSGSGRGFMPAGVFVPLVTMFGTGQLPVIWPTAKMVAANSQFSVTLTNLTAVALNVYLVFHGFAVMVSG